MYNFLKNEENKKSVKTITYGVVLGLLAFELVKVVFAVIVALAIVAMGAIANS